MAVRQQEVIASNPRPEPPPASNRSNLYLRVGVASACLVLAALAVSRTDGRIPDDSYILLRYARNLLDGHGWVYNLQQPTSNAVSAPLYTLVLTLLAFIVGDVETAMTTLFVFTTAASGYLAFEILHRNSMALGGLAATCLMIFNPWLLVTQGLETSMFVCLLLLSVLLLASGKHAAVGAVLVAATLVRGDGAVMAAVVFVLLWIQTKRLPWRLMIGAVAATALWAIAAVILRVPLIPDTLAAKYAQGRSGLWGDVLYLRGFALTPEIFGFMGWAAAAAVLGGTGLLLLAGLPELRRYLWPYILGTLLLFAAYGFILRPPSYHWYYGPQLTLIALCGAVTIEILARAAAANVTSETDRPSTKVGGRLLASTSRRARLAALVVAVFVTGTMSAVGWRETQTGPDRPEYLEASDWLKDSTPDGATVALAEIGVVGWFSDREIVDFLGLLSKDSVEEIRNKDAVSWLSREEPDYWIVHQPLWPGMEAAAREPWFVLAYRPAWTNGELVAWAKYRSIDDAQRVFETEIEPAADRIGDKLAVAELDRTKRKAISSLVALASVRDDLRDDYSGAGGFNLAGLMEWVSSPGGEVDEHGATLQEFAPIYRELASEAETVEVDDPPKL